MQGNLDEFLAARERAEEDNYDAGPEIAVRSRATSARSGAAYMSDSSTGAAMLNVRFCTTRRTLEELNQ